MKHNLPNAVYVTAIFLANSFKTAAFYALIIVMVTTALTIIGLPLKGLIIPAILSVALFTILMWAFIGLSILAEKKEKPL